MRSSGLRWNRERMELKTLKVGRVVELDHVTAEKKLAVIVDFFDHTRVLVDGPFPKNGAARQAYYIKHLKPTEWAVAVPRNASTETVARAVQTASVHEHWLASPEIRTVQKQTQRKNLSDFDRFCVRKLLRQKKVLLRNKLQNLDN